MSRFASFILETANNPGTGPFALSGAPPGRRGWSDVFTDGEVYYFADDGTKAEWGVGRLSLGRPATISRDRVIATTQNRTDHLNFMGLVYVYSDRPAEVVPPPASQGISVVPDKVFINQTGALFTKDVTASGATLRADFAATLQVHPGYNPAAAWQAVRLVINIWTVDAQGNSPAQPIAAAGANARILQPNGQTVMARTVALDVTPGSRLRLGATLEFLASSSGTTPLSMTMRDAATSWISI
ncbi:hypothetical protein [Asaia krungthepensis]|uniref:Minor tail protein n=1 Tax=Asaia krungthepensis NRIC 0535 TaxID=1307925 RepID=A0ABQ0Q397_9PROT|nr:hypothetical protein [Asaia krungthepensis]GBQ89300.1 hypothetical protein AA0535_1759 [Asaia krungthepensis NRIC 0535]